MLVVYKLGPLNDRKLFIRLTVQVFREHLCVYVYMFFFLFWFEGGI